MANETIDVDEVIIPHGKMLEYSDDGEGSWKKVRGTVNINLPERELSASEFTNDDSPNFTKEYIPGMYEPGTVGFSYKYNATGFAEVEEIFQLASDAEDRAEATKVWRITLPDGSTTTFTGFLTSHNLPVEGSEDVPDVEAEIQVTGAMTYTPASGS